MMLKTDRERYNQVLSKRKQKQSESDGRTITKINRFIAVYSLVYKDFAVQKKDTTLAPQIYRILPKFIITLPAQGSIVDK